MRVTSVTNFRKKPAAALDSVSDDLEPILITRTGGKTPAVLMSLEDFDSWEETCNKSGRAIAEFRGQFT